MALFKRKKNEEEETRKASSSGGSTPRVIEAAKNLYQQVSAAQQRAVQADMAVQQAQTQRLQEAARGLYSAYQQGQQQRAQAQLAQDQATMQRQQRMQTAARNLYQQAQQQQQRAVQANMAVQQAGTQRAREAARGLYSAYLQGQEQQARAQAAQAQQAYKNYQEQQAERQQQRDTMRKLQLQQIDPTYGRSDAEAQAEAQRYRSMYIDPVTARANERQSSLSAGDPNAGAGRYASVQAQPDYAAASRARNDTGDALYDYINDQNDERLRQQAYATQRGALSGYEKYTLMTEQEKGTYNYLYNTQGKEAAEGFLAALEPELDEQWYSGESAYNTEVANQDTGSRIISSIATVGAQPVRTLGSTAALVEDAISTANGQGINPYSEFRRASTLTQDIRGTIEEEMNERYPGTFLGMSAGDVYSTVMSALDSAMNMAVAGTVGEGVSAMRGISDVTKIQNFTNVFGSALMSSEAAAMGVAESKQKGYSDAGALSLGLIRGGIEYLSEKLGGDWVIKNIKTKPGTLIHAIVHAMIPEGIEEVMSDLGNEAVNAMIDNNWGLGEDGQGESYIGNAYRYYKANGSDNPLRDTLATVFMQEWKSFAGGALSSFGSGTTFYIQQRGGIQDAARTLHTDADGVRALMQEMNTDNPSAVQYLAEIYDVDNVEDLRERYGTMKSAEAAIDAAMREQGAAENEDRGVGDAAPYDNGLAGNDNAPRDRSAMDVDTEGVPEKRARSREERELAAFNQERNILEGLSPERREYLREKRTEHATVLDSLHVGDEIIPEGEDKPALRVISKSENGMMVAMLDENGEQFGVERILPETFTGDQAISVLETAGNYQIRNQQGTNTDGRQMSTVVNENGTGIGEIRDYYTELVYPEAVRVGKTTEILTPYKGQVPTQNYQKTEAPIISADSARNARSAFHEAKTTAEKTGERFKTVLSRIYSHFKGPKNVRVNGMEYNGKPYDVDVPNGLPGKLASQGSADGAEFTILDNLKEIIERGEYLGSGDATKYGQPKKKVIRYDYFETEVSIEGNPVVVRWEVEVVNGGRNYKTHRLTDIKIGSETEAGPLANSGQNPSESEPMQEQVVPIDNIPQPTQKSNSEAVKRNDINGLSQNGHPSVEVLGDHRRERRDAARKSFDAAVKDLQAEGSYGNYDYWQAENKYFSELAKISGTGNNLLQELAEAEEQYHQAAEGNNTEYDYSGELDWINTLRERIAGQLGAAETASQNTSAAENGTNTAESAHNTEGNAHSQKNVPAGNGTSTDPRRELRKAEQEYMDASNRSDPDYDYEGQLAKIKALREQVEAGENPSSAEQNETKEAGGASSAPTEARKDNNYDSHPERGEIGKDGVRVCRDTEALEAEINEIGGAKLRNDTGEYFARVRGKTDGGVLLTIDHDGKRDTSKTFATAEEASAWAASYIDGQTNARTDAELDQNKSEKIQQQTMTEALFSGEQQDEYERQKKNKAAEMSTQALRERMKKTDAEIRALRRLEKTTGLSETQKSHMEDLQQSLEILNDELKSRKGRARAKKEKVQATGNKPTQSAAEAKNAMMDTFHTAAGQRVELGKQIDRRLVKIAESGKITENDRSEIMDMLMDAGAVREEAAEELKDVRQWLRGARIYVSEHDRADFGDNWNELRRRAWAAGIYLTDNMTDRKADSLNAELAETFGERMFPTDAALSDMLSNLVDKAEAGRSQMIPFAQAIENEARGMRMDPQEIYNELSQKLDETLRTYAEKAKLEVELKNRTASQLATERKRMEDRLERQAQRRRESEIRDKTLKALRRLEKLRGKAASDVRAQIDEAIKDIDTQARSLTMSGIEDLQALQQAYEDAKKAAGWESDEHPGNWISKPYIEEKLARLSKIHLNDMDIADVIELGQTVQAIENQIRTQNQMIGEEFDKTIKETADAVDRDVKASKGAKPGFWQKWFKEESLGPRRFLSTLDGWKKDGAMGKLADSLEKGQTRMLDFLRRAEQSMDPFMEKKENKKWLKTASGKKATWSTYGVANGLAMDGSGITGQSIEITPMMKIALYLHSLNEDNLRHIQEGGIRIPNKELYIKGKMEEAYAAGEVVKMQPQAVRAIASTLTQQEKTFAGYLQKFFNEQSKAAINEVSLQLDGFERANVENYFPIETDKSFVKSDVSGEARARTVEGIGSIANERVHAQNPIRLCDAYDTFVRQVDNVGRYYGYAIPIRNFQAVNNFVFHEEGNAWRGSVKDTINRKWGTGAESYITKMLQDLQGGSGTKTDMMSRGLARIRSNLAGSSLAMNPNVAFAQCASYPGAAQTVGWDGLAAGLVAGPVDEKLIEKYTPLLWYRSRGYSTQEIGDAVSAEKKSLPQKLLSSKYLNWIQGMDRLTVKRIWAAAEYRVQKDNPGLKPGSKAEIDAGTDEYYRKVAEVFDRAVYDTQPNYTNMERAQILRSESEMTKMLTMYKTVPLQYYGMMVEAAGRLQSAVQSGNKTDIAEARRYAVNTFGGILAANSIYVVMKALIGKGFRKKDDDYRDEEGNLTAASVGKQLGKDLMETYAGSVIGGAEAYSLIDGWIHGKAFNAPEVSPLATVEDIANDANGMFSAIGDGNYESAAKKAKSLALDLSAGFGLPVRNAESYILAAVRWASPETAMEYDNLFGGIHKGDLKSMDGNTVSIGAGIILRNRTGAPIDRSTTDELSRLYGAGFTDAIPTNIPESFSYGGKEVKVNRGKYSDAWGAVVGDNLEELLTTGDYQGADDKTKQAMIRKLYQYATVQARMDADPEYSAEGNSTYGWTLKADEAVDAGIELPAAIAALTMFSGLKADTENGKTIVSKKAKVFEYINGLDLDSEQKDLLYELAGYEKGLEDAPWHGGSGAASGSTGGSSDSKRTVSTYEAELAKAAADPSYTAPGWTIWTGTAVKAGINAEEAITHYNALAGMKADYDQYGKAITGSKKAKVCNYIDALDLTADQKDVLYLSVYKENSLKYTTWHGWTENGTGKSSGRKRRGRRGGGRRRRSAAKTTKPVEVGKLASGFDTSIDIRTLFGGGSSGTGKGADISAGTELLDLVNKYYNGNPLAAAMDGGRKARTSVDFKL